MLCYHGICKDAPDVPDQHGLHISRSRFEEQMRFLKRAYRPVTLAEVRAHYLEGGPLPDNPVLVTIDDGYENVGLHGLPLLQEMGIPGVLMPVAGVVDAGTALWPALLELRLGTAAAYPTFAWLKSLPVTQRQRWLQSKRFDSPAEETRDYKLMGWEALGEAVARGFDIGSHGLTHEPLVTCTRGEILRELSESKRLLEDRLGVTVDSVAYPFGDADSRTAVLARGAGYRLGFTTEWRPAQPGENALLLPRIAIKATDTLPIFAARLAGWDPILDRAARHVRRRQLSAPESVEGAPAIESEAQLAGP